MSRASVPRGFVAAGLIVGAAFLAACTPLSDGGTSTTTTTVASTTTTQPPSGSVPTITDVEYAQSGVRIRFAPPATPAGPVVNYLYDLSCNGGTTVSSSALVLGTTASPAIANTNCGDGAVSSYRLTAVENGAPNSAPSAWRSADPLSAPVLTDVQYATSGISLHFTAPAVATDESVTNYVYDLSCNGGSTTQLTRAFLATTASPAIAGNTCPDGTPSSYRIAAIVDSTWTSPYTAWRTADALVAPTLTAAALLPTGATLTIGAPPVGSDESVTDYRYDLSCDGGATVHLAGQFIGSSHSPATVTNRCAAPASSTYRIKAVVNSSWTSPLSAWRTAS
jgi:hypothetical protein